MYDDTIHKSNVCRSPIAEGLAKKWLSERHGVRVSDLEQAGFRVQSRGISTEFEPRGSPASAHGMTIMRDEHGVDITSHRSALLSQADVFESTHIYCMAQRHHDAVLSLERRIAAAAGPSPKASHSTATGADNNKANRGGGKDNCLSFRSSPLVSVFKPEIPDPWHGNTECYRKCTELIAEAVAKALEEDIPMTTAPQQQQERAWANRRGEGEDTSIP